MCGDHRWTILRYSLTRLLFVIIIVFCSHLIQVFTIDQATIKTSSATTDQLRVRAQYMPHICALPECYLMRKCDIIIISHSQHILRRPHTVRPIILAHISRWKNIGPQKDDYAFVWWSRKYIYIYISLAPRPINNRLETSCWFCRDRF